MLNVRVIGLGVLVILHLLANVVFHAVNVHSWFSWDYGLTLCEIGLLSWWVVFGGQNVVLALSGYVAGAIVLFVFGMYSHLAPSLHQIPWSDIDWAVVLGGSPMVPLLSAPITLCVFLLIGCFWTKNSSFICSVSTGQKRQTAKWQFSMRDVFVLTTSVAVSLGSNRSHPGEQ